MKETIICLANSRKPPAGRCIAGKIIRNQEITNEWIRPVSERESREVSEEERRYQHGKRAQLLDKISIPLKERCSLGHQVENYTLDPEYYWTHQGVATWDEVTQCVDEYDANFWRTAYSTRYGIRDKLAEADLHLIGSSLKLIMVDDLTINVAMEEGFEGNPGRRRARASFTYHGQQYKFSITDPEVEENFLGQENGDYEINNAAICISLVEPWNGYAFRVVASIITEQ